MLVGCIGGCRGGGRVGAGLGAGKVARAPGAYMKFLFSPSWVLSPGGSVKKRPPRSPAARRGHYRSIGASLAPPTVPLTHVPTPRGSASQLAPIVPHRRAAAAWLDPPGALPRTGRAHLHYRGLRLHYSRIGASHGTRSPRQVFKGSPCEKLAPIVPHAHAAEPPPPGARPGMVPIPPQNGADFPRTDTCIWSRISMCLGRIPQILVYHVIHTAGSCLFGALRLSGVVRCGTPGEGRPRESP